jgi:hypothetical protein
MPRFVVLTHDHPFPHWDLMLEAEGKLRTWRLLQVPNGVGVVEAEPLVEHRLDYLDYEGPVSGGRGSVARWDRGEFRIISEEANRLEVQLSGERLSGRFELVAQQGKKRWSFQLLDA